MRKALIGLGSLAGLLVLAFLALRTPDIPAAELRAKYGSPASQFLEIEPGFTVHLRDEGPRDAPAVILLHGSNASLHTWEPWIARLGGAYRVVTMDLQGHGLTGPHPDGCYTRTCMVSSVEAVRAKLEIEQFAIGGSSMGGAVAWGYALAHPDRVQALVLVAPSGAPLASGAADPIGFRLARTPVVRDLAAVITPRKLVEQSLEQSVSVPSAADAAAVDRYWELLRYPGNRRATLDRAPNVPATAQTLAPLRNVPILVLWGDQDRVLPLSQADFFKTALPGATLIVYPGIGHLPQEETPDLSAVDVKAFLAEAISPRVPA